MALQPSTTRTIVAASSRPVDRLDVARFARIPKNIIDDQADVLDGLIDSAVRHAQAVTDRQIMPATLEAYFDAFPTGADLSMAVPRPPLQSVTTLSYVDQDGATQTLTETTDFVVLVSDYQTTIEPAYGTTWPVARSQLHAVTIQYVAGYADADAVPAPFKQYVKTVAAFMFDNRHAAPLPSHTRLLDPVAVTVMP